MKRVPSVSEFTIGLWYCIVWSVPDPCTPMWWFGTNTILEVTGSTRCYVTISFLSSWSHLLLFAVVFCTSGTFSASFPVNMFLPPLSTITELFRTLWCMWYWRDIWKCNVSCVILHAPGLWCRHRLLSASSTTSVGLAHPHLTQQVQGLYFLFRCHGVKHWDYTVILPYNWSYRIPETFKCAPTCSNLILIYGLMLL